MKRTIHIAILILPVLLLTSCSHPSDNNITDHLKIKDLAPTNPDGTPEMNRLKTMNLDLQVLEIPTENFNKLNDIRRTLKIRPLQFYNYLAFSDNSFSAYYGQNQTLRTVYDLLGMAGAQNVTTSEIMLPDGESQDLTIVTLPQMQTVSFSGIEGSPEAARVGPGAIVMHVSVKKTQSLDDAGTVTIYPMFTVMSSNTISELSMREKLRDFSFTSAALRLDMKPGDFIVLAPESLITDQSTLCGLFFCNPYGSMFMNFGEKKLPERKPSVRVYILTCVGMNL
jgi:hypothetical protein